VVVLLHVFGVVCRSEPEVNRYFANPRLARTSRAERRARPAFVALARIQKGAVLIVKDQIIASLIATVALAGSFVIGAAGVAGATEPGGNATVAASSAAVPPAGAPAGVPASAEAPAAANVDPPADAAAPRATQNDWSAPQSSSVTLVVNGTVVHLSTRARTVGDLLEARGKHVAPGDFLYPDYDDALADGMKITYRRAVASAPHRQGAHSWIEREHVAIVPATVQRTDNKLAFGETRIARGTPGVRETTIRCVVGPRAKIARTVVATRVLRTSRPTIVFHGTGQYQSFANVAARGIAGAMRLAGTALHMLATAYTASCYGCSGITASGLRAGFGIIAVDPRVIPLGTRLFIPGYGRAIAGDTGGAIHGNRIDLGFNSNGQAVQWGYRPVTVYVLR